MQVVCSRSKPEAARPVPVARAGSCSGQGPSGGLPAIPLHDHPQGSGRRRLGRARAPDQDRSRLEDDRRCHRPGDDGPGRRRGRDRAPGPGDQGVAQGSRGTPSRAPSAEDALPQAAVRQPDAPGGMAPAESREPHRQRADLGRAGCAGSARSRRRRRSWSGSTSRKSRIPRSPASSTSKARWPGTSCGSTCSRSTTARARIATRPTCRSRSSTSSRGARAGPTASRISPWRASRATAARGTGRSRTS